MQCYTELTPPTAISHSLSLPFLSASSNNLIVAKTSLLQIYSLKSIITYNTDKTLNDEPHNSGQIKREPTTGLDTFNSDSTVLRAERLPTTKLVLVAQYELSGTITSLARVKILQSKSGGEALLVALRDAKLSLVEWDPERFSISTISIHYYEREDIPSSPWEPDLAQGGNYLSVDPSSRCAILNFGKRHVAILPFHQVGDDLVMDDYDPDIDGERPERKPSVSKNAMDGATIEKTPYAASFVLSLLALDPALSHPIHLSFLHEYREPTFGVLYSQIESSSGLLHERRDNVSYAVYTLDLEQRASTTLLSVNSLPWDVFAIVPLLRSIGGALLVGSNEVIHIDQSGKSNGIAVNEFAKRSTSFPLVDQAELDIRLEHCIIKELGFENPELLIILNTGELAILSFRIDGRSVSGLSMRRVQMENGGGALLAGPSSASTIGRGRLFVGSEDADSTILGWSRKHDRLKRKRSGAEAGLDVDEDDLELDEEDIEDDEDDLYADDKTEQKIEERKDSLSLTEEADYVFRVHDSLTNVGPMTDIALRTPPLDASNSTPSNGRSGSPSILTTSGRGRAGGLTIFQREVGAGPAEKYHIDDAQAIWSINIRESQGDSATNSSQRSHDRYFFVSKLDESNEEKPTVYRIKDRDLEEMTDVEFDSEAGDTVDVGVINGGTMIAQVSQYQVRTYDADFGLAQIQPLTEPDLETLHPRVISASFADPYILVMRDGSSAVLLTADERGEFDETNREIAGQWISGSLYEDSNDVLRLEHPDDSEDEAGNVLMFLLSATGGLHIYRLPNLSKPVYVADGLSFLPPFLSTEFNIRRSSAREALTEILVTELGDTTHKSPYLILRSSSDDLVIYQPYQAPIEESKDTKLRFLKIPNPHIPEAPKDRSDEDEPEERRPSLRVLPDVGGYSAVFKPGSSPSFIIKSASSQPQVFDFAERDVQSLSSLHTPDCRRGYVFTNGQGKTYRARLPSHSQYETGWVTRRIPLGEEVHALSYHAKQDAYVLGTSTTVDFKLPEDEFHPQWMEEDTKFLPQVEQGSVKLLDAKTLSIIDNYPLPPYEMVTTIKTLSLETSEHTHIRAPLIAVGTARLLGTDLPSTGHIYIFNPIPVVPHPSRPETGLALKLIAKEETKGPVTAISGIGTQGFLLVAQGQKMFVRGLKEDGTLLPVAFMDLQVFGGVVRELEGTGCCLVGDAVMGVRFVGYMEEPYQLTLFGKSPHRIEVIAADFLPDGKQLYIIVADASCNIHVLQFDPEHPKSLSGQRLLHHTTFHTGHFPSTLTLLPTTNHQPLLLTTQTGTLALLTPLSPSTHRTLTSLQQHLQNTLPHHLGLNPRSYRSAGGGEGRAGIVDGAVLGRWAEGGRWRVWAGEGEGEEGWREGVRGVRGVGVF